jgi:hypothetical protein
MEWLSPVSILVTVTSAFGITAPVESETCPKIVPVVDCAFKPIVAIIHRNAISHNEMRLIFPP